MQSLVTRFAPVFRIHDPRPPIQRAFGYLSFNEFTLPARHFCPATSRRKSVFPLAKSPELGARESEKAGSWRNIRTTLGRDSSVTALKICWRIIRGELFHTVKREGGEEERKKGEETRENFSRKLFEKREWQY